MALRVPQNSPIRSARSKWEHQAVGQFGAGSGTEGLQAGPEPPFEVIRTHCRRLTATIVRPRRSSSLGERDIRDVVRRQDDAAVAP